MGNFVDIPILIFRQFSFNFLSLLNVFINIHKYVNYICKSDYCVKVLWLTFHLVPILEV